MNSIGKVYETKQETTKFVSNPPLFYAKIKTLKIDSILIPLTERDGMLENFRVQFLFQLSLN